MASIYKRKSDGRWTGSVELGYDEFGKRIRKFVYGDTKKEVEKKINAISFEVDNGTYEEPDKDTLISFLKEYHRICAGCDMWSDNPVRPKKAKWESTTAELYKMYIDVHFEPYFKQMKLKDVKPMQLDKFYNYLLSRKRVIRARNNSKIVERTIPPLSVNSVRKLDAFLKAAFNYAIVNKNIKDNPTSHVVLAKKTEYKPKVYNEEQFLKLLNDVAGTDDEIPIILGAGCGFRRAEIFGLYWRNIDFNKKTITIEKTNVRFQKHIEKDPKTETSKRTIYVPDYVINTLRLFKIRSKHSQDNDKVITSWKPDYYSKRFKKLLCDYNLPPTRLHDLRHYNAVIMMKKNIPDKVAAERLGHSTVSTLRKVYQHVMEDMDTSAANKLNDIFTQANSHQVNNA